MKTNLYAFCLFVVCAGTLVAQEPQTSPSDEPIAVPSELAPAESIFDGDQSSQPSVEVSTADCCVQVIPMTCWDSGILPVVYQEINSSPVPTTPATPTPVPGPIGANSVLQNPSSIGNKSSASIIQSIVPQPIQQNNSTPFVQPSCCGGGQVIGSQVAAPRMINSSATNAANSIAPNSTVANPGSVIPGSINPGTVSNTNPVDTNWNQSNTVNWTPVNSFDYGFGNNCCPQNRGFFRGNRFFGRRR